LDLNVSNNGTAEHEYLFPGREITVPPPILTQASKDEEDFLQYLVRNLCRLIAAQYIGKWKESIRD
jgi:hypothetical protein